MKCGEEGEEMRMRTILAEPKFGGQECPKNLKEMRKCVKPCKKQVFLMLSFNDKKVNLRLKLKISLFA